MNQINKYLNHITWTLNALKEHIQIVNKQVKSKIKEKEYLININFQKFNYCFNLFYKLEKSIEKGYKILLTTNKVNKKSLSTLHNIYLYRSEVQLNESIFYLKSYQLQGNNNSFIISIFSEIKNIASLLNNLESDINFLMINLN